MANRSFRIILPYRVIYNISKTGKIKAFTVNLNQYRNAHYRVLHNAKKEFKALVEEKIQALPELRPPIVCSYEVYKKTKTKCDVNNICTIADKFFMDALVELGKLPDDNEDYYLGFEKTRMAGIDKENPRIEVVIREILVFTLSGGI